MKSSIMFFVLLAITVFQVGKFIQLFSTLFGSFIVALTKGWLLSLVLMSSIPLIAAAGAAMSLVIFKSSNRGQKAYAQAGTVVEHTVGSIRTVCLNSTQLFAFGAVLFIALNSSSPSLFCLSYQLSGCVF